MTTTAQQPTQDLFDELFEENIGSWMVFYTKSRRAVAGRLRGFDKTTVRFDAKDGTKGGSVLMRDELTMATVSEDES